MTTIATKLGKIAGDSMTTAGHLRVHHRAKVGRLPGGAVFGCCGRTTDAIRFERWRSEGGDKPKLDDDFQALEVSINGVLLWDDQLEPVPYADIAAIGSGMEFALGAMHAGASAEVAVQVAAGLDVNTGGTVTALEAKED